MLLSITKPPAQVWRDNYSSLQPFKPLAWEHPLLVLWLSLLLYSGDRPYFTGIGNISSAL
ncbi:hypothetical protein [Thiofilum flexile]|uniref:hypothetical protein n=1 Tax=Thiofilum flexile TaxID=125627 RepID=UPI00037EFCFD|nr:hypothetical protein [Thiofilum flexile]